MTVGLLFNSDEAVADYLFSNHVKPRMKYDQAIGILTDGKLTGGILFQCWNGFNVEGSYYGAGTITPGIVKCLARILVSTFNVSRVTVTVNQRSRRLMKALQKFGFVLEGHQRCFYGSIDSRRNTGVRFVMFRDRIDKLCQWAVDDRKANVSIH